MTTSTLPETPPPSGDDMVVDLDIVGGLDAYLNLLDGERTPLIKYDRGSLTLVTPSRPHERAANRLDRVVTTVAEELAIPYYATASTLYRRRAPDSGIMADKTYYIQRVGAVLDLDPDEKLIDLDRYPPPDLAIEVVVTHSAKKSLRICAELGVPEVWVFDHNTRGLTFRHLDEAGSYATRSASLAFPFVTPADVQPWVGSVRGEPDNQWAARLRAWVRDVLGPRRA